MSSDTPDFNDLALAYFANNKDVLIIIDWWSKAER
jgi:hypothetical protein